MAELIAHDPQRATLRSSGFYPEPKGTIEITDNGIYIVKPYESADVNIPLPSGSKEIRENGIYNIYRYSEVVVNVPTPTPIIDNTGIDLLSLEEHKGYRQSNGSISGNGTDPNWSWFDPVNVGERTMVFYRLWGYTTVMSLMVWNANGAIIDTVHIASGSTYFSGKYTIPNGGTRIAVSCFNTRTRTDQICVLI